jgi:hypothetical protein
MNLRDRIATKIVATGIVAVAFAGELAKQNTSTNHLGEKVITKLNKQTKELEAKLANL